MRSVGSYSFRGDFSGLRIDDAHSVANGFHTEDRFGQGRCLGPGERAHGRAFECYFALINVDDDQAVDGQRVRTHGLCDGDLQLHIIGLFRGRLGQFV